MAILRLLAAPAASLVTWNAARDARRALVRLSRRELADIGLHSGDIELSALMGGR